MVRDEKAEKLEHAGLYRRAACRWLDVLKTCKEEHEREWIVSHRAEIQAKVKPVTVVTDNFSDVTRAAAATQDRMGLSRQNGSAFRIKGDKA